MTSRLRHPVGQWSFSFPRSLGIECIIVSIVLNMACRLMGTKDRKCSNADSRVMVYNPRMSAFDPNTIRLRERQPQMCDCDSR